MSAPLTEKQELQNRATTVRNERGDMEMLGGEGGGLSNETAAGGKSFKNNPLPIIS
jgi:hypothetical protein